MQFALLSCSARMANYPTSKLSVVTGASTSATDLISMGTTSNSGHMRMFAGGNVFNAIFLSASNITSSNSSNCAFKIQSSVGDGFTGQTLMSVFPVSGQNCNVASVGIGTDTPLSNVALDVWGNINLNNGGVILTGGQLTFFSRWGISNASLYFIPYGSLAPKCSNIGIGLWDARSDAIMDISGNVNIQNGELMSNGVRAIQWTGVTGEPISYTSNVIITTSSNLDPLKNTSGRGALLSVGGDIYTSGHVRAALGMADADGNSVWLSGAAIQWQPFSALPSWLLFEPERR